MRQKLNGVRNSFASTGIAFKSNAVFSYGYVSVLFSCVDRKFPLFGAYQAKRCYSTVL